MQSRIPLPTDNIYKFYALFGLILLISSMAAVVGLNASYNNKFIQMYIEFQGLDEVRIKGVRALKIQVERREK